MRRARAGCTLAAWWWACGLAYGQCTCLGIAGDANVPMCSAAVCQARNTGTIPANLSSECSGGVCAKPPAPPPAPTTAPTPKGAYDPPPPGGVAPPPGGGGAPPGGGGAPPGGGGAPPGGGGAPPGGGGAPHGGGGAPHGGGGAPHGGGGAPPAGGSSGSAPSSSGGSSSPGAVAAVPGGPATPPRPSDRSARMAAASAALPGQLENISYAGGVAASPLPRPAPAADFKSPVLAGAIAGPTGSASSAFGATARALDTKFKLKDFGGALKDADHLIDLEPENHEGYARRAEVNNALAKYSDAERDALEAVKRDPADVAAWKALARARLAQGKAAQAKDAATLALEIDPNDAEAYLLRADAEDVLGDHEAARRDRAKAAELELQAKPKLLEQSETGSNAFGERPSYSFPFGAGAPDGRVPWAAAGLAGFSALSAALGFAYWKNRRKRGPVGSIDLSKPT